MLSALQQELTEDSANSVFKPQWESEGALPSEEKIVEIFKKMDKNNDGMVTVDEYNTFVQFMKLSLTAASTLDVKPIEGMRIYEAWHLRVCVHAGGAEATHGRELLDQIKCARRQQGGQRSITSVRVSLKGPPFHQILQDVPDAKFTYKVHGKGAKESRLDPLDMQGNCLARTFICKDGTFEDEGDCLSPMYNMPPKPEVKFEIESVEGDETWEWTFEIIVKEPVVIADELDWEIEFDHRCKKHFCKVDADGNGWVEPGELGSIFEEALRRKPSDEEVKILMEQTDKNNDGAISYNEFKAFCRSILPQ